MSDDHEKLAVEMAVEVMRHDTNSPMAFPQVLRVIRAGLRRAIAPPVREKGISR